MSNYFEIYNIIFKDIENINITDLASLNLQSINENIKKKVNKVRVRRLTSQRIGHLALNTEEFMREYVLHEEEYKINRECILLINVYDMVSNYQLFNMIKRKFPVIDGIEQLTLVSLLAQSDPELWDFNQEQLMYGDVLNAKAYNASLPQLTFTDAEEIEGKKLLKEMGIEEKEEFVCFHNRDSEYLDNKGKGINWSYHDYRDNDINNYIPSVEKLTKLGYIGIRMGHIVKESINSDNTKIIDYARHYRSDFGDVYLSAKCKFLIGNTAGLFGVSSIFNVPVIMTNLIPMGYGPVYNKDLYIPKKCWYKPEKRFLTFRELIDSRVDKWGVYGQNYLNLEIEVIENTSEEIWDVTKEMHERLNGTWVSTEGDEILQKKFQSIYKEGNPCYGYFSRIGAEFLRQNKELLD